MLRRCLRALDTTRREPKVYKYGYIQDPRKMAPYEAFHPDELTPAVIRPPMASLCPTTDAFLDRIDVSDKYPVGDFKSSFGSWDELMTATHSDMVKMGMSKATAYKVVKARAAYANGRPPLQFDKRAEKKYFAQFKANNKDGSHRKIPDLPEKYRPHQQGQDQRPTPDYVATNAVPEWAQKEDARLAAAGGNK